MKYNNQNTYFGIRLRFTIPFNVLYNTENRIKFKKSPT